MAPSKEHEAFVQLIKDNAPTAPPSVEDLRQGLDAMAAKPVGVFTVEEVPLGAASALWISTPLSRPDVALLHFHGGGYIMGSKTSHLGFAVRLANALGARVLLLDYRLAPEHLFPAPIEDALAAHRWLMDKGVDSERLFFSGDSAGGGLVIAALLALKAEGGKLPRGALCSSPWVDLTVSGETAEPGKVDDLLLSADGLRGMAAMYASGHLDDPPASPLFGDLSGLPPLCITVGTREVLLDDARRLVHAAQAAGVHTRYFEETDLTHCWPLLVPDAPESAEALVRFGQFVDSLLA